MINKLMISNMIDNLKEKKDLLNTKSLLKNFLFFKNFSYKFSEEDIILFNKNNPGGKIYHIYSIHLHHL